VSLSLNGDKVLTTEGTEVPRVNRESMFISGTKFFLKGFERHCFLVPRTECLFGDSRVSPRPWVDWNHGFSGISWENPWDPGSQSLMGKILRLIDLGPIGAAVKRPPRDELIRIPRQGPMSHVLPVESWGLNYSARAGGLLFTPDGGRRSAEPF
jgi:hypothetical protein